jgi:hypothetical protein
LEYFRPLFSRSLGVGTPLAHSGSSNVRCYSADEFSDLLRAAGFDDVKRLGDYGEGSSDRRGRAAIRRWRTHGNVTPARQRGSGLGY